VWHPSAKSQERKTVARQEIWDRVCFCWRRHQGGRRDQSAQTEDRSGVPLYALGLRCDANALYGSGQREYLGLAKPAGNHRQPLHVFVFPTKPRDNFDLCAFYGDPLGMVGFASAIWRARVPLDVRLNNSYISALE